VLCPLTEEPCTYTGKKRLTECFVDKFRKKYYNIPELEYTAQEFEKCIRHSVYSMRDLRHSIMKILSDDKEETQVLRAELCTFFDTFPCKLALLTLYMREATKLDVEFLHHMNNLYKGAGKGVKQFLKAAIHYPLHKIGVITSLTFETCITLADLQLSASLCTLVKMLEEAQKAYIAWTLLLMPLYLLYLEYRNRGESHILDMDIEALCESSREELDKMLKELMIAELARYDAVRLYMLAQPFHDIIRKLLRGSRTGLAVVRVLDKAHTYVRLKEVVNNYEKELRELVMNIKPRCILSPFSIYVLLGTVLERDRMLKVARNEVCRQYTSDEYTYTFRMYSPVNAVLDDVVTKLCAELMITRQEYLFKSMIVEDGSLLAFVDVGDLKEMPIRPTPSVIPPTLITITFTYSSLLDILSWLFSMADNDFWNFKLSLVKDETKRQFLTAFKMFVVDELNEVTDLMYDVLKVFYVDEECEKYYIELLDSVRNLCESSKVMSVEGH